MPAVTATLGSQPHVPRPGETAASMLAALVTILTAGVAGSLAARAVPPPSLGI
ncbi:hypothetical protein AB0958_04480 [Streptomyces sp. NPDC006655]|uniref:hypothetical protein n=1 Tax=Streptomyces sp. NPDC006655 TaxID=3156898 RepID=UPI00345600EE